MEENLYKHHFELLDRYQSFSAEILRLDLATIAAFGFFLTVGGGEAERISQAMVGTSVPRNLISVGLVFLVLSAGSALAHRYVSTDAMHYILLGNTRELKSAQQRSRDAQLKRSTKALVAASISLALGVALLALSFMSVWLG